jgi:DNA repair protein RadC
VEGSRSLTNDELFALLIGSGHRGKSAVDVAKTVLDKHIGFPWMYRYGVTAEDLCKFPGIKRAKAERIIAAIRIGRLLYAQRRFERAKREALGLIYRAEVDRLEKEVRGWNETSLLAKIIGSGVRGRTAKTISEEIIKKYGGVRGLYGRDLEELKGIKGIDEVRVNRIEGMLEVADRLERALQI